MRRESTFIYKGKRMSIISNFCPEIMKKRIKWRETFKRLIKKNHELKVLYSVNYSSTVKEKYGFVRQIKTDKICCQKICRERNVKRKFLERSKII